jgi:hypothetical protein
MVAGCRFVAPEDVDDDTYTHVPGKNNMPVYVYTCVVEDIAVLKGEAYRDVSRALNLEGTRALGEGEEAVGAKEEEGEKKMVWDVVDATFAVFEEVENRMFTFPFYLVLLLLLSLSSRTKGGIQ